MSGESRYAWTHHIPQRKYDRISGKLIQRSTRVSLTFRNVRGKPCTCLFPKFCDIRAQEGKDAEDQNFVLDTKTLPNVSLQNEFVTKFYDTVAEHFSRSRYKPWPKVETFLSNFQSDSFIADIGCGNGKYLGCSAAKSLEMYGIDISKNLVQICKDRGFNAQIGTIEAIPFSDEKFDGVICIAVFHHLHSLEIRIQALIELCRICKPKSRILIYAWAFEQEQNSKRKFEHQDVFVPWELQEEQSVSESPESSSRIYDTRDGVVFNYDSTNYRYCHLYKKGELEDLVKLGNVPVSVVDTYYDTSNWCIVLEKL
jgi:alkylated DNA repair protein alkB family protein 8